MRFALSTLLLIALPYAIRAEDKFVSTEGKYSIAFPKAPMESTGFMDFKKTKVFMASYDISETCTAIVFYCDYPELIKQDKIKANLDAVTDGIRGDKGKISDAKDLELGTDKVPGRTCQIERDDTYFQCRVFIARKRLYQVVVSSSKKKKRPPPPRPRNFSTPSRSRSEPARCFPRPLRYNEMGDSFERCRRSLG